MGIASAQAPAPNAQSGTADQAGITGGWQNGDSPNGVGYGLGEMMRRWIVDGEMLGRRMMGGTFGPGTMGPGMAGWQNGATAAPGAGYGQAGGMMGRGMMGGVAGTGQSPMGSAGNAMLSLMAGVSPMHADVEQLLGMSQPDLYHQMAAGQSLAQIAAAKGVTETQLMDGMLAGRRAAFDQAVAAGRMTRGQADAMLGYLQTNLQTMVDTPGMGLGTGGWGMMWSTQPGQPSQSGK
jgi:hypothetical protein